MARLKFLSCHLFVKAHKEKLDTNCVVPHFMMKAVVTSIHSYRYKHYNNKKTGPLLHFLSDNFTGLYHVIKN